MKRISDHSIDPAHVQDLLPIPVRINMYIDGYGAMKSAMELYEIGDKRLAEHLRSQANTTDQQASELYDQFHAPPSAAVYADIIGYCLALIELYVIASVEDQLSEVGTPVFPNALLVNRSNPINLDAGGVNVNLLEKLYPLEEWARGARHYVDATCDGTIYSPKKINRERERDRLKRELAWHEGRDPSRAIWIKKNLESIEDGVLHFRNRDGTIGNSKNFEFTETFYDEVSNRIGSYSRRGETKVHWGSSLVDFGEKGVDCDLIMQVMDDLHRQETDVFVFMTNDMDFFPLIERLKSEGKPVFLCGLKGNVSYRLIDTIGRISFFDLLSESITANLPTVFMAMQKPELRSIALQWAWLALRREQKGPA